MNHTPTTESALKRAVRAIQARRNEMALLPKAPVPRFKVGDYTRIDASVYQVMAYLPDLGQYEMRNCGGWLPKDWRWHPFVEDIDSTHDLYKPGTRLVVIYPNDPIKTPRPRKTVKRGLDL